EVQVRANRELSLDEQQIEDIEVDFDLNYDASIFENKKDPLQFRIELQIDITPKEDKNWFYELSLKCIGLFEISEEIPEEKRKSLVYINGASMLYSAAREYIFLLTMRGPYPPIYIPSVSFKPEDKDYYSGLPGAKPD
ncbi:MAG TPA: protein-export chaperone SecB, partial [Desulfohalobiaceae bacterium]|nr:protein-export chaperone SecB [Desulfohalobiaceae bacterium]